MKTILIAFLILCSIPIVGQTKVFRHEQRYAADSVKKWMSSILRETSIKHPGFYRYTPKSRFNSLIDSTQQTIKDSLTTLEYYRKLKPLFAAIGCVHTGVTLSKNYNDYLNKSATLLPLAVFIDDEQKVYITKNYSTDSSIQLKSEILSINGQSTKEIVHLIYQAIPSDGFNETEKKLLLNHRFAFWYQTVIDATPTFKLEVLDRGLPKTLELNGVNSEVFPSASALETNYKKPLEFEQINDGIGVLKIHTFAQSTIKKNSQNFKKFTRTTFKTIAKQEIKTLVIDLRYNTGGTDGNAAFLAAYFFNQPFRYWEKIEVTEALAKEVKGLAKLIYRKPVKNGDFYQWQKSRLTHEFDYYEWQKPAKNNFQGQVYLLTNGLCLSSCSDFIAILAHNQKAKIIGQESGGGYQGNTSGIMPTVSIPGGLRVTIPLMKYTNAVDLQQNFGHGTIPDYAVSPTLADWMSQTDVEMEFFMHLIKEKNGQ
jgi:hypothetical protein